MMNFEGGAIIAFNNNRSSVGSLQSSQSGASVAMAKVLAYVYAQQKTLLSEDFTEQQVMNDLYNYSENSSNLPKKKEVYLKDAEALADEYPEYVSYTMGKHSSYPHHFKDFTVNFVDNATGESVDSENLDTVGSEMSTYGGILSTLAQEHQQVTSSLIDGSSSIQSDIQGGISSTSKASQSMEQAEQSFISGEMTTAQEIAN